MHVFPLENRIPLGKVAINFENNHEIYHFPVWRRKSGHVVRSRSHTCEKISTGGKKDLLALLGGNSDSASESVSFIDRRDNAFDIVEIAKCL